MRARLRSVLGPEFAERALTLDADGAGARLHGWVGLPTDARSQADQQYFYVNGRLVRDRLIAHAVRQAYSDVLFHGRHPAFVLYLDLDPTRVDVNVHPAKHEVRFREGRIVHDMIYRTLHEALAQTRAGGIASGIASQRSTGLEAPLATEVLASAAPVLRTGSYPQLPMAYARAAEPLATYRALYAADPAPTAAQPSAPESDVPPLGFALAQLHGVFILAENPAGLVLVDMLRPADRRGADRTNVSRRFGELLRAHFDGRAGEVLNHPRLRLHVVTSRGRRGLLHREHRIGTVAGYLGAYATNALSRRALGAWLQRVVFSDPREPLPLSLSDYPTAQVALTVHNLQPSILASGSIPFWLRAVHDIPGGPPGAYWDGGITDYHLHWPWSGLPRDEASAGLVLYPHFSPQLIPGWLGLLV